MKLRKILVVAVVSGVALATSGWLLQREAAPEGSVYQQARLFEDVLAHVADYYVDSLDERQLYQMAIDGMLDQLHDPYSVFLKRDDFRALSEATTGNYGGLGIQIDVRDGWITVIAPLPDTPAWRGGVEPGDRIVALDGRSTEGWKNDQAVKELRGEPGTKVELRVRRVGLEQPITFKLTHATIHIRSVQVAMLLDDKVGFVQLSPVSETSAAELTHAVDSLVQKGMKSLILDLRYNPGGLLDQGVAVSELFLEAGQEAQVVAAEQGRDTTKADSAPVFHADRGRAVVGGGGIRPDLFVGPDTFTTAERNYMKALGDKIPVFRDVLSTYSLELKGSGRVSDPTFVVGDELVAEVLRRLRARGAGVPDSVAAGARTLIAHELGNEAARYVFGRPAEVRRRLAEDHQVQAALALARRARSPQDLLTLAPAKIPANPRN